MDVTTAQQQKGLAIFFCKCKVNIPSSRMDLEGTQVPPGDTSTPRTQRNQGTALTMSRPQ